MDHNRVSTWLSEVAIDPCLGRDSRVANHGFGWWQMSRSDIVLVDPIPSASASNSQPMRKGATGHGILLRQIDLARCPWSRQPPTVPAQAPGSSPCHPYPRRRLPAFPLGPPFSSKFMEPVIPGRSLVAAMASRTLDLFTSFPDSATRLMASSTTFAAS